MTMYKEAKVVIEKLAKKHNGPRLIPYATMVREIQVDYQRWCAKF